ncbi:MAG: OmpA family protein [Bacteroidales bacterium]|nr:OmpA family protein [Bacteroidales bacterium]
MKPLLIYIIITMCGFFAQSLNAQVKSPIANLNTSLTEIAPIETDDGKKIYFARIDPKDNPEMNCDVWMAEILPNGKVSVPTKMPDPINSKSNNVIIKASGNTLFLEGTYNQKFEYVSPNGITKAELKNNVWKVQPITIKNLNNRSIHSSYALSSNNRVLIIAADREGGAGLLDLYVSFLTSENTFSQPVNLGSTINTAYNDGTPFIAADNTTLYFNSYGHGAAGSADIFMTRRLDDTWTNWTEPVNIGPQFNTPYWDAYLHISADGKRVYMVSSNANADENIYQTVLPQELMPLTDYEIRGSVTDHKRHDAVSVKIVLKNGTSDKIISTCYPNDKGEYSFTIKQCGNYTIETESQNYLGWENTISIKKDKHIYTNNIDLVKIESGVAFTLGKVYFQPSSHQLNTESTNELKRLAKLMKSNTNLRLTVNGYTASGIDKKELEILSENRAKAVKAYLVQQGISPTRITCKGFGELTNPNEKDDRKRVEFVLSY